MLPLACSKQNSAVGFAVIGVAYIGLRIATFVGAPGVLRVSDAGIILLVILTLGCASASQPALENLLMATLPILSSPCGLHRSALLPSSSTPKKSSTLGRQAGCSQLGGVLLILEFAFSDNSSASLLRYS